MQNMQQKIGSFASAVVILVGCIGILGGCSVVKATKQPGKKDVSVLKAGTPRGHVIAELGSPVHSEKIDGCRMDIFAFTQGYSTGAKSARALFHGAADVATLGLWEVVGTPAESMASGREVSVQVQYDQNDCVQTVKALKGAQALKKIKTEP